MDSSPGRDVTITPALPCHICGTPTTIAHVEHRGGGRWILAPVCTTHLKQPDQSAPPDA
jgi:hypothetical protein